MAVPPNIRHKLPNDPAIPLLGIYPKELKAMTQTDICTPTFIVALITVAKPWAQHKCPWTDEWIQRRWITHRVLFSLLKKTKRKFCHLQQHG